MKIRDKTTYKLREATALEKWEREQQEQQYHNTQPPREQQGQNTPITIEQWRVKQYELQQIAAKKRRRSVVNARYYQKRVKGANKRWKECSKCGEWKPTKQFYKDKRAKDKLCSQCKICRK